MVKEILSIPDVHEDGNGNFTIKYLKKNVNCQIPEDIINVQVMPSSSYMLWEEEYDASAR